MSQYLSTLGYTTLAFLNTIGLNTIAWASDSLGIKVPFLIIIENCMHVKHCSISTRLVKPGAGSQLFPDCLKMFKEKKKSKEKLQQIQNLLHVAQESIFFRFIKN